MNDRSDRSLEHRVEVWSFSAAPWTLGSDTTVASMTSPEKTRHRMTGLLSTSGIRWPQRLTETHRRYSGRALRLSVRRTLQIRVLYSFIISLPSTSNSKSPGIDIGISSNVNVDLFQFHRSHLVNMVRCVLDCVLDCEAKHSMCVSFLAAPAKGVATADHPLSIQLGTGFTPHALPGTTLPFNWALDQNCIQWLRFGRCLGIKPKHTFIIISIHLD